MESPSFFIFLLLNSRLLRYVFVVVPCEPKPCDIDPFPPLHIRVAYLPPILVDVFFINNIIQYNICILFRNVRNMNIFDQDMFKKIYVSEIPYLIRHFMIHRPIVPSAVFWTALVASASLMSNSTPHPHPPRTGDASGEGVSPHNARFSWISTPYTHEVIESLSLPIVFTYLKFVWSLKSWIPPLPLPPTYYLRICTPYQLTDWFVT